MKAQKDKKTGKLTMKVKKHTNVADTLMGKNEKSNKIRASVHSVDDMNKRYEEMKTKTGMYAKDK